MGNYELTVILPGKTTSAKVKTIQEKLEKLVKLGKGKIKKFDEWGKIELAYKIDKEREGVYLYFELDLLPDSFRNLNDKLKVENDIMRYLLVRTD